MTNAAGKVPNPVWQRPKWRKHIPFLVRLRDCEAGRLPDPADFPKMLSDGFGSPSADWLRSILRRRGKPLILFDGVDEIPSFRREDLYSAIQALVDAYQENYFLVSSRPKAVPDGWLTRLGFREARINPMSAVDVARFIDHWHEAVGIELLRGGESAESVKADARELKEKLPANPPIARLATNPRFCDHDCSYTATAIAIFRKARPGSARHFAICSCIGANKKAGSTWRLFRRHT